MESLNLGDLVIPDRGAISVLKRTVDTLENAARKINLLRGFYHLHVCPLPDLQRSLPEIKSRLFRYLSATVEMQAAERMTLWSGREGQAWTVEKVHSGGSDLAESMSIGGARWEGEVREELTRLLASTISTKASKSAIVSGVKVLLLVDAYHYGDADDWKRVTLPTSAAAFHTVARVYQEHACQVLTSMTSFWR